MRRNVLPLSALVTTTNGDAVVRGEDAEAGCLGEVVAAFDDGRVVTDACAAGDTALAVIPADAAGAGCTFTPGAGRADEVETELHAAVARRVVTATTLATDFTGPIFGHARPDRALSRDLTRPRHQCALADHGGKQE
jgi:hypothetical protein